jgi:hypothetical protein
MPFTADKSLDPETLKIAQEAFDLAWGEITADLDGAATPATRDVLAKRIIAAAQESGERDPARLKAHALAGFALSKSA